MNVKIIGIISLCSFILPCTSWAQATLSGGGGAVVTGEITIDLSRRKFTIVDNTRVFEGASHIGDPGAYPQYGNRQVWVGQEVCYPSRGAAFMVKDSVSVAEASASNDRADDHGTRNMPPGDYRLEKFRYEPQKICFVPVCLGSYTYTCRMRARISWKELTLVD